MAGAPENNQNARKWNLTDKQKRFYQEYIIDFNQTEAAKRAGYSKKTAYSQGNRLLKNVEGQKYLSYLKHNTAKKLEITHEMLTEEWAKMAFSSFAHLHNTWIERKEFEELKKDNPDILDCIQEIQTKTETKFVKDKNKTEPILIDYIKLKLYDKQRALENLGKNVGYYLEDNKQKRPIINGITFNE